MQHDDLHARAVRALADAWERASLAPESLGQLAASVGLSAPPASLDALAQARLTPAWAKGLAAHPAAGPMVSVLRANPTSNARGDGLRRAGILAGVLGAEEGLKELLAQGALVARPGPARQPFVLATELGRRTYLGRELELPPALAAWLATQADFPTPQPRLAVPEAEVSPRPEATTKALEHNLLRVVYALEREPLPLNRDGSPHRRALGRVAQSLAWEPGEADLLGVESAERLHHLLSLAVALGLLEVHFQALFVAPELGDGFFLAAEGERDRLLWKAWRGAGWSELAAWAALRLQPRPNEPRRAPVAQEFGAARLAGIRQQLQDDLRKLGADGWFRLDAAKETLLALDRGYLAQGLDGAFGAKVQDPARFVEAVLALALPWMGFARLGRCADGATALRWTPRGRRALGLDGPLDEDHAKPAPWVVQPNLEVAVFLDEARLDALAQLYKVGAREVERADRVARFVLEPEAIQRAYGRGVDADAVIAFLQAGARAALPASVEFALRDWDRVHRRVTIYAGGALVECEDPEKLDALLDALAHAKGPERDARRLGPGEAFLPSASDEALAGVTRALEAARVKPRVLDLGLEGAPTPSLKHVEGEVFEVAPGGLDLVTAAELPWVALPVEPGPSGAARWRVEPAKVTSRWGAQAWPRLESFLRPRLLGPWSGNLRLGLRALVEPQRQGRVEEGAELLLVSDPEVADALLEIPAVEEWVQRRLGPSALWLARGGAAPVRAWLQRLGLAREVSPQAAPAEDL